MKKSWKELVIIVGIVWFALLAGAVIDNQASKQTKPEGGCIYIETNQCFCHGNAVGEEGGTKG